MIQTEAGKEKFKFVTGNVKIFNYSSYYIIYKYIQVFSEMKVVYLLLSVKDKFNLLVCSF